MNCRRRNSTHPLKKTFARRRRDIREDKVTRERSTEGCIKGIPFEKEVNGGDGDYGVTIDPEVLKFHCLFLFLLLLLFFFFRIISYF